MEPPAETPAPAPAEAPAPAPESAEAPAPDSAEAPAPAPDSAETPAPAPDSAEPPAPAPAYPPAPAPAHAPPLSLSDILAAGDLLVQKEAADKATLESIGAMTMAELRSYLIVWGRLGFPNAHVISSFTMICPSVCSDGVAGRSLGEYIVFCSGKTLSEHIEVLQAKVTPDIQFGFADFGGTIGIVVTRMT